MPAFRALSRQVLIEGLRRAGFEGPYSGGNHQYMQRGGQRVWIANPHGRDIGLPLLARTLRQAGISREEWERL